MIGNRRRERTDFSVRLINEDEKRWEVKIVKEDGNEQMGDSDWVQKTIGTGWEIQTGSRRRERTREQKHMGYSHWEKVLNSNWKQKTGRNRWGVQLGTRNGKEYIGVSKWEKKNVSNSRGDSNWD